MQSRHLNHLATKAVQRTKIHVSFLPFPSFLSFFLERERERERGERERREREREREGGGQTDTHRGETEGKTLTKRQKE